MTTVAPSFRGVVRRPVRSVSSVVERSRQDGRLATATATAPDASLAAWLAEEREELVAELRAGGVMLLRGFAVREPGDFATAARAVAGALLDYEYASTPRTAVGDGLFTATEYPADQRIPLHNELSFASRWPALLWLHCRQPAEVGGATPLADARRVCRCLSRLVRRRFAEHGVLYVRNHGGGLDLPLEAVFGTSDRRTVEAFCRREGISWRWKADGGLRTWRVGAATVCHPVTGEEAWFNQAHLFHPSSLEPAVRAELLASLSAENLPRNALYGDGRPIEDGVLEEIRAAYEAELRRFTWQAGDVAVIDNVLVAHGRDPYVGERRMLLAMTGECASRLSS